MAQESEEEKVIISRRKLEELEQAVASHKLQITEERNKFKESAKYCIKIYSRDFHLSYKNIWVPYSEEKICTNTEVIKELSEKRWELYKENQELKKKIKQYEKFCKSNFITRLLWHFKKPL